LKDDSHISPMTNYFRPTPQLNPQSKAEN